MTDLSLQCCQVYLTACAMFKCQHAKIRSPCMQEICGRVCCLSSEQAQRSARLLQEQSWEFSGARSRQHSALACQCAHRLPCKLCPHSIQAWCPLESLIGILPIGGHRLRLQQETQNPQSLMFGLWQWHAKLLTYSRPHALHMRMAHMHIGVKHCQL